MFESFLMRTGGAPGGGGGGGRPGGPGGPGGRGPGGPGGPGGRGGRGGRSDRPRSGRDESSQYIEKVVGRPRRVAKVVKGGRRFSFS
ncbi:MAG: hypothetical protein ABIS18_10385, partial [Actinomycetota bacterium]